MELYIDAGRTDARCTTPACKRLKVFYRVKDNKIVDDPRLQHHDSCSMEVKNADKIREEQFCREFLVKVSATMIPPKWEEFENQFTAKFGTARFTEVYGTREEQQKFTARIGTADTSKVEIGKAEEIFKDFDDFTPDVGREEDVEETESTDAQLNESLQNMILSDKAASTTATTSSTSTSTTAASSAASSSSTTTTTTTTTTTATMSTKS
uniref:Uncharacterized protein n=1 Tax=Panagrolaimus davidi TaxID=227884 RepID=A0A914PMW9_9BILA